MSVVFTGVAAWTRWNGEQIIVRSARYVDSEQWSVTDAALHVTPRSLRLPMSAEYHYGMRGGCTHIARRAVHFPVAHKEITS